MEIGKIIGGFIALIAVFFGITVVFGSWYTVDQTERGVVLRNGALTGLAQPGLHCKMPWFDDVHKVPVKTITWTWDKMNSYSFDQQPADLKISVTVRPVPDRVADLYARFGSLDAMVRQVVSPVVNKEVKVVFGHYTAVKAIQQRGQLNGDIKDAITKALSEDPMIIVESVQLENIEFSQAYLHSIEQRMLAEVEVQKLQQNAEREKVQAQITVTQANAQASALRADAQAKADSVLMQARANADATRLRGEAEASAIHARGEALAKNPGIIELVRAERWNGSVPSTMIPGAAVPMVNLK